jgi:hypothetical protein
MLDTGYRMLDSRCILSIFIQLNYIENNDHYLNKLGNKAACGFSSAGIKRPESSIMNVQLSRNPLFHKGSPRFFNN